MAFNLDHTACGNLDLAGSYTAFTGSFTFPKPVTPGGVVTFLTQEAANVGAVSGLQSCIDLLVNCIDIGTASTLNADNTAYNAICINGSNLIDVSLLPDAICSCAFVVTNSGQLVLLNQAKKGSVAITSNTYRTYVLGDGLFNNIANWIPLLNPDNCIDSVNSKTGVVLISGKDLSSTSSVSNNVSSGIQALYTGLVSNSCLNNNYRLECDFLDDIVPYATTSYLTSELNSYATTQCVSDCLGFYTDNNGTGALFAPYALASTFGTASESQHNVGTGNSCILCVGVSGCIDASVLPDVSLVEAFDITAESDLISLSTATIGDVAFDTVHKFNYILIESSGNAYQDLNNWKKFSAEEGSLLNVNGHTADPNNIVTLYGSDLCGINSSNSIIPATSTFGPVPVDGSLVQTNVSFYIPEANYAYVNENDYLYIVDQTNGSTFSYYAQVTLIQFAGGFGYEVQVDVLGYEGIASGPSTNWKFNVVTNLKDNIEGLQGSIDTLESEYKTSGSLVSDRGGYVLESVFNGIASGKSITGHIHSISDVSDLDSYLYNISPFEEANTINLDKSYSYTLGTGNTTTSCGSLIIGEYGKAKNNYSLVQSPGKFAENGDAQYSSMAGNVQTANTNWTTIIDVELDTNSIALLNAGFVSRAGDSFSLEGAVIRQAGSVFIADELSKSIYSTGSINNDVRVCAGASTFALQVKGQSYWTSSLEMISTKISGVSASGGVGSYWQGFDSSSWYNVTGNWFTENTFTQHATSLPSGTTDVQMVGSVPAVVDLDCASWIQPNSIDTTAVTNADGICFVSATGAVFNGTIYGNAEFFGAVFM